MPGNSPNGYQRNDATMQRRKELTRIPRIDAKAQIALPRMGQRRSAQGCSRNARATLGDSSKNFSLSSCPSLAGAGESGRRPDEGRQGKIILQRGQGRGEESKQFDRK